MLSCRGNWPRVHLGQVMVLIALIAIGLRVPGWWAEWWGDTVLRAPDWWVTYWRVSGKSLDEPIDYGDHGEVFCYHGERVPILGNPPGP